MIKNTLLDVFEKASRNRDQAFYTKDRFKFFRAESFTSLYEKAETLALFLMDKGIKKGDRVSVFSDNRAEWMIADMAILLAGAVTVPRGSDSTETEIEFILNHSESSLVFIEHQRLYKKISRVLSEKKIPVIVLDSAFPKEIISQNHFFSIHDIVQNRSALVPRLSELKKVRDSVTGDDLFTIIYTSGTTGNPKGVMLTHSNMMYQLKIVPQVLDISQTDRILSILPVWHIFERFMHYSVIDSGACCYYTNIKDLMEDFIRVKPTLMASAPRLWEQVYHKLHERIEKTEALNRELFNISYGIKQSLHRAWNIFTDNTAETRKKNFLESLTDKIGALIKTAVLKLPDMYMDPIFLVRVRAMLGGELKGTLSGGGALPVHIDEFFNAIGIPVYEGYGMTECSPLISLRPKGRIIEGTVGFTPEGTQVRLMKEDGTAAAQGEQGVIFVKGPGVMKGYYKNPDTTALVLNDGWMNTGDIGVVSVNGALSIRGRAKDTIVLLSGENVEPVPIETILTQHVMIEQAVVVGQDRKHLGVLIWPNYEKLEDAGYAVSEHDKSLDLNQHKEIRHLFLSIVHRLIGEENGFKSFERVTDLRFLPDKLRVGETLTNLQKIKRNVVFSKYENLIQSMYGDHHL
ncbi:MAG TPA: long-chain fatty acid--CoA ligase [Leptospiraceae bacterium]|nr:long-chain fatty acid--CoA ligase [Leptospiraceae bacterium]HNN04207.1 long-chain fatty acid--CoA ligase [Leptospiraceae bacterium]